jgi:hypothetical protein
MTQNHSADEQAGLKGDSIQPMDQDPLRNFPDQLRIFTTPLTRHGWPVWLVYVMAFIGLIYILNPTLGIFELLPDNLPLVGNLDEGLAFLLIWFGLVEYFGRKATQSES